MIKTFKDIHPAYDLIKEEYIEELRSTAGLLRHKKTGARIALLSNEDTNKVFSIGFRTTPVNSTGVAHIMEHSVLCGSEKFPVKDPFVELVKGSLNTFLNAMTYPDKTIYPIASLNHKDFRNLMHVYLDAVFKPNIYIHPEIFKQEGWHYEMEDADSPLTINGVVYNEMKGAYSNPEEIMYREILMNAYPDTTYGNDSGGNPDCIPDLTYEDFLDFHRKYYHPSNSYIYLYGDCDMASELDFIDREYLSTFGDNKVDSEIDIQRPFGELKDITIKYPVNDPEDEADGGYLTYNMVMDKTYDQDENTALQILEYVLMESPAAPLKRALLDAGIGKDIYGSYDPSMKQPLLSIIAGNADIKDKDRFLKIIRDTLKDIREKGLNKNTLAGAINSKEFSFKEGDFGSFPKGLLYHINMYDSWLYDEEHVFTYLKLGKTFDNLRKKAEEGYFEELLDKYFLNNDHTLLLTMEPKAGLNTEELKEKEKALRDLKESLSKEEIDRIVRETKELKAYQEKEEDPKDLETIPVLDLSDIKKECEPIINEEIEHKGIKGLSHDTDTNGILYQNFLFDVTDMTDEEIPYISLLTSLLGKLDTKDHTYSELADDITINMGGFAASNKTISNKDGGDLRSFISISAKTLRANIKKTDELLSEILSTTDFSDDIRLKELIGTMKAKILPTLAQGGSALAVARAESYISREGYLKDALSGLSMFMFVDDLDEHVEERADGIKERLKELKEKYLVKERLMLDITADKDLTEEALKEVDVIIDALPEGEPSKGDISDFKEDLKNEAFIIPGNVQFNAVAGDFRRAGCMYDGALIVLENLMTYDYLWNNIRVKGGAYGCSSRYKTSGEGCFSSYRDPNLKDSYRIFKEAGDYVRNLKISERDLKRYIIGAISNLDLPLSPAGKGSYSLNCYFGGMDEEYLNKRRMQVLNATAEKLNSFGAYLDAIYETGARCTVGTESAVNKDRELFKNEIRI